MSAPAGYKLVPIEPTKEMLEAGYKALAAIYPPKANGGSAIGQFIVYEAMLAAAPAPEARGTERFTKLNGWQNVTEP